MESESIVERLKRLKSALSGETIEEDISINPNLVNRVEDSITGAPAGWVIKDPDERDMPKIMDYVLNEARGNNPNDLALQNTRFDLEEVLSTPFGFLEYGLDQEIMDSFSYTGEWVWESYQEKYFRCLTWFITNKCRQGGGSAMLAAEKFAKGILSKNNYSAILTSFKRDEATGKIDYVRQFLEALPPRFRKKIIRDPHQLIEFQNANGTRVKILSHAQKPIRGINGDVGLDELAFYSIDKEIYKSALPAVAAVRGKIDIISTPFGKSGTYYEIWSDPVKYPEFFRLNIKWWECRRYLKETTDEFFIDACINAEKMTCEERVHKYGNIWLIQQLTNADDEDTFRQEFEGFFVDAQAAFFHRDLLLGCMFHEKSSIDDYNPKEEDFFLPVDEALADHEVSIEQKYKGRKTNLGKPVVFKKYKTLSHLYAAYKTGEISPNLYMGGDIGATHHATHISIIEDVYLDDGIVLQIERYSLNKRQWDLPDQEAFFEGLMRLGIIRRAIVDATGIGMHIGQSMVKKFGSIWVDLQMGGGGNKSKLLENMMINLKSRFESQTIALSYDKIVLEDLYKIEKILTANKTISFKSPKNKRHHSDAAWAVAFASIAGTPANTSYLARTTSSINIDVKKLSNEASVSLDHIAGFGGNPENAGSQIYANPDEKKGLMNAGVHSGLSGFLTTSGLPKPSFD